MLQVKKRVPFFQKHLKIILIFLGAGLFLNLILLGVLTFSLARSQRLLSLALEEKSNSAEQWEPVNQTLRLMSTHANQVRNLLGLERVNYPLPGETEEERETGINPYYRALNRIYEVYNQEKGRGPFEEWVKALSVLDVIKTSSFSVILQGELEGLVYQGDNEYFYFSYDPGEASFLMKGKGAGKKEKRFFQWGPDAEAFARELIRESGESYRQLEEMTRELEKAAGQEVFLKQNLGVRRKETLSFSLLSGEEEVAVFGIHREKLCYFINAGEYKETKDFVRALEEKAHVLTPANSRILKYDLAVKEVTQTLDDKSFKALLKERGFKVSAKPRKDEYFTWFDLKDPEKSLAGSFAVDNFTGSVYLMDKDGIQISSMESFRREEPEMLKKKKIEIPAHIPEIEDLKENPGGITFLLCGSNGGNTDTIIIVDVNREKRKIILFAIPRDLYYKGDRINTINNVYGTPVFLKELSHITGLKIGKYIHIDMFAFIEVINLLGGVEVTLDRDLADPDYKVKDNGQWSTLFYSRGTHHVNGLEALRLARSRKTTSDFDRSLRQQKLLEGIRKRIISLGFQDLGALPGLIATLLRYVETNMSPLELFNYYKEFKDWPIESQHILSSANVLEASYSNTYLLDKVPSDPAFNKGKWILIPRGMDWNLVKWYIREILE